MTRQEINSRINKKLAKFKRCYNAVVRINGRIWYLKEHQMRALQLCVIDMSQEEYKDFCESIIIYNGCTVKKSTGTITIQKDGRLNKPFESGFCSINGDLAREFLFHTPRIVKNY